MRIVILLCMGQWNTCHGSDTLALLLVDYMSKFLPLSTSRWVVSKLVMINSPFILLDEPFLLLVSTDARSSHYALLEMGVYRRASDGF